MKRIFVLFCLLSSVSFTQAQGASSSEMVVNNDQNAVEGDESQWVKNRIGLYGSFFSGYGLSYQYQFESGISLRTQLFAYGNKGDTEYNSDEVQLTYGADIQYNLKRSKNTRLYVLAGSFIDYNKSGNNYSILPSNTKDYDFKRHINAGVGFGMELIAWRHVSFVIEGGYYGRFGNNSVIVYRNVNGQDVLSREKQTPKSFGLGMGGGIFYAF